MGHIPFSRQAVTRKSPAAKTLVRAMTTETTRGQELDDQFAVAVAHRLAARGIAHVPELSTEPTREEEFGARLDAYIAAQREQDQEDEPDAEQMSTPDLIRRTMAESYRPTSRADMPLNGPGIIAAAGGNPYAANGFARDSVADLIRREMIGGSVQDGRRE